jgi:alcohol dehydrogenase class IV
VANEPDPGMPIVRREDDGTRIVLGPGVVDDLEQLLLGLGATRVYLVTGPTLAVGAAGIRVRDALGSSLVGTYARSQPHVPSRTAEDVAKEARKLAVDALVGLGGGSPIGTAKAAAFRLHENRGSDPTPSSFVAAIPTTYAGSEVTSVFGTTDMEHGRKSVVRNASIRPRLALYDPELALDTPPDLTAATGVNALAHCVEGLYSKDAGDAERSMAVRAATLLVAHLPKAVDRPRMLVHRYHLFEGSMDAGLVLARAGMGIHHGLCHVLGGRFNAPHGVLNAIVLPHAMRFNLPVAESAYRELAPAFGLPVDGADPHALAEDVCGAMTDFIRQFRLPSRLRDLQIPRAELPAVAQEAMQSQAVQRNPRPLRNARDALRILEAAW